MASLSELAMAARTVPTVSLAAALEGGVAVAVAGGTAAPAAADDAAGAGAWLVFGDDSGDAALDPPGLTLPLIGTAAARASSVRRAPL